MPFAAEGLVSDPLLVPPVAAQPPRRKRAAEEDGEEARRSRAKEEATTTRVASEESRQDRENHLRAAKIEARSVAQCCAQIGEADQPRQRGERSNDHAAGVANAAGR